MGADEHYLEHVPVGDKRSKLVDKIYKTFKDVLGLDDLPNEATPEIAAAHIIAQLQNHQEFRISPIYENTILPKQ
jgi:hypothetical protein